MCSQVASFWVFTARLLRQLPSVSPTFLPVFNTLYTLRHVVEQRKTRLTAKQSLRSNVDWLTEAVRRFSEAYALGRDFSTVTMSNVFHSEKVGICTFPLATLPHLALRFVSGKPQKLAVLTASGMTTRWLHLRMPFLLTALSYAPSAMRLAPARSTRSYATMDTGKSTLLSLTSLSFYLTVNHQK